MGIFQGDLIIKTAIELGMDDMRKNPWLIDDMLSDATTNVYLKDKYGQRHVDACKEWFKNNQIDVYMAEKGDHNKLPCVTIMMGNSPEKADMKHMADLSTEKVILLPNQIGKPIAYVVKPFVPVSYDPSTGLVEIPDTTVIELVSPGMILVNPDNGTGYVIKDIADNGFLVEDGLDIDAERLGVLPQYQYYEARVEHSFFQDTYTIGCHVHGDPNALLWLHSIVLYSIMRYRESLLEANGFSESLITNSDMLPNEFFTTPGGEKAWSRYITISGQVENTWIKSPRRFVEKVGLRQKTPKGYIGGIRILSNLDAPDFVDKSEEVWYTDQDENGADDE
jgi:hypothetical protein